MNKTYVRFYWQEYAGSYEQAFLCVHANSDETRRLFDEANEKSLKCDRDVSTLSLLSEMVEVEEIPYLEWNDDIECFID